MQEKNDQQLKMLNSWILKHCDMYDAELEEDEKESVYLGYLRNKLNALKGIAETIHKFEEKSNF